MNNFNSVTLHEDSLLQLIYAYWADGQKIQISTDHWKVTGFTM
jgi:hypothetical protein